MRFIVSFGSMLIGVGLLYLLYYVDTIIPIDAWREVPTEVLVFLPMAFFMLIGLVVLFADE